MEPKRFPFMRFQEHDSMQLGPWKWEMAGQQAHSLQTQDMQIVTKPPTYSCGTGDKS